MLWEANLGAVRANAKVYALSKREWVKFEEEPRTHGKMRRGTIVVTTTKNYLKIADTAHTVSAVAHEMGASKWEREIEGRREADMEKWMTLKWYIHISMLVHARAYNIIIIISDFYFQYRHFSDYRKKWNEKAMKPRVKQTRLALWQLPLCI